MLPGAPVDVLVVAPHPDDAEIGAGGTIARWVDAGRSVLIAVCTSGDKGTSDPAMPPARLAAIRQAEQGRAAGVLGVAGVVFLDYPDQGLQDSLEFRTRMVRLIRTWRPGILVTADPYRRYLNHRDHRITGQVCLDAVFPCARDYHACPDLIAEGLLPHVVREMFFWQPETVNCRIDITATFQRKVAAVQCHASQTPGFGTADVRGWLQEVARREASGEAFELAEGFYRLELPPAAGQGASQSGAQ